MWSSPTSSPSLFTSLSARPPTPPRDIYKDVDDAFQFLQDGHCDDSAAEITTHRTPNQTDTPRQQSPASSQARGATAEKKVDFSPFPTVHDSPRLWGSPGSQARKQNLLRQQKRPLKSILKTASDRLPLTPDDLESKLSYFSPQEPGSFPKMLQSVLTQLASQSRDDRRDAYLAINGALKHYEGIPDSKVLCEKMAFIQQFLSRDITWKDDSGRLDSSIVMQALQLTMALMHHPETEPTLDDDFRNLLMERSMTIIEQEDIHKGVYKLHMYLMSQQRFKPHILTPARADRLLSALQGSETRCSGNGVIASRLIVYTRLLKQAPSVMLNRMRDWIDHVFNGLLSSIADVRLRAIDTCVQAGLILGEQPQVAKVMYELAEKERLDEKTYGDYLNLRLKEMSADKDLAKWVPQIWGAVILLFRCKRRPVEKWPCFKDWLATIQRSLNSSDIEVKQHANIAWSKLVYAVMPGTGTTESMKSMLRIPITAGLEKRGHDRVSQQHRQIAMDSYCNLLHYGLRPGLTHEELDQAWELYVEPILIKMAAGGVKNHYKICAILQGLLRRSSGVWNKNAVNEIGTIKPGDLPRLEPRWVRSRLVRLIRVLEPVIEAGMWTVPDANEAANTCWRLLLESIAEAGSQEVKASLELKEAMAQLTNFFRRIWHSDCKSRNEVDGHVWLDRFHILLETAVECLGPVHFVEDVLSKTGADDLEAAPTPSHRSTKHSVTAYPALVFLFALYYQVPPSLRTSDLYKSSAATLLRLLAGAKGSITGSLSLLHRALQFADTGSGEQDVAGQLWDVVAQEAVVVLTSNNVATPQRDAHIMGNALRSSVNILLHGLRYADSIPNCLDRVLELYASACLCSRQYANEGGVVLGVMEPLAKSSIDMLDELSTNTLASMAISLLENGVWPKSRHELDRSRKSLWTVSLELPKTSTFDPFEQVYGFLNGSLARSYKATAELDEHRCQLLCRLLESFTSFLQRAPITVLSICLQKIQAGLESWIQDCQRTLFLSVDNDIDGLHRDFADTVASRTVDVWFAVATLFEKLPRKDTTLLRSLGPLFRAGFSSPSRDIVAKTITIWNRTFGQLEHLEYPISLQPVLRARQAEADLELPGFSSQCIGTEASVLPAFAAFQRDGAAKSKVAIPSSVPQSTAFSDGKAQAAGVSLRDYTPLRSDHDHVRRGNTGRTSTGTTPRARLRHDDSQVEFAPIPSSSPQPTDVFESQLLTEHQKEVKSRQHGDAQMYPDLSSSPAVTSRSQARNISKKLDFTPSVGSEQDLVVVTPTGLVDANPMSDDIPSSPTPRSNAILRMDGMITQYNEDDEETVCDPPSSPPRMSNDDAARLVPVADITSANIDTAIVACDGTKDFEHASVGIPEEDGEVQDVMVTSDLPSDTQLPTVQLIREATVGDDELQSKEETEVEGMTEEAKPMLRTLEFQAASQQEENITATQEVELTTIKETQAQESYHGSQAAPQTPSGVQESLVEANYSQAGSLADDDAGTETSTPRTRGRRKRKRTAEVVLASKPAKKRATASPFGLWDRLRGNRNDEIDDMEEEIVVAGSQPPTSPERAEDESAASLAEPQLESQTSDVNLLNTVESIDQPTETEMPAKRKRGRPRKSEARSSSKQPVASPAVTRKRGISVLDAAGSQQKLSTSLVEETPALTRARKSARTLREGGGSASTAKKRGVQVSSSPPRVDKPSPEPHPEAEEDEVEEEEEEESEILSPSQQLSQEAVAALGRRIAQPKSILGRLREVLADCKKIVFGSSQEEREFDDVLFEIRREVHEAGRLARDR